MAIECSKSKLLLYLPLLLLIHISTKRIREREREKKMAADFEMFVVQLIRVVGGAGNPTATCRNDGGY